MIGEITPIDESSKLADLRKIIVEELDVPPNWKFLTIEDDPISTKQEQDPRFSSSNVIRNPDGQSLIVIRAI